MALIDGDYRAVEKKIVAALLADTDSGGICESGDETLKTVRAGDAEIARGLGASEFPAVLVRVTAKSESPRGPSRMLVKSFEVAIRVISRGLDREALEDETRRIASRIEKVVRGENAADRQFQGLPDEIDGGEGVLAVAITDTVFSETSGPADQVTSRADVRATVMVPCSIAYE